MMMNDYLGVLHKQLPDQAHENKVIFSEPDHMASQFIKKNGKQQAPGITFFAAVTVLTFATLATSAQAQTPPVEDLVKKELAAFYYSGKDMSARVSMRLINAQGSVREREMAMLRTNKGDAGDQRYMMVFDTPADVRGMSFLIWKYAKAEGDRWMYLPGLKAIKRIAADDKKSSFVGSDFTYEDISGRPLNDEQHTFIRADQIGDRKVYVVESKPKGNVDYAVRSIWIDQERWLPLKEEYTDAQGKPLRIFSADKVEQIGGLWTVTARSMKNLQTGHKTEVIFKDIHYNVGLNDDVFTERNMKNPVLGK